MVFEAFFVFVSATTTHFKIGLNSVQQLFKYLHVNGLEELNFLSLSTMAKSVRSGTENLVPDEISHVGLGVGIRFSNMVYQLGLIFLYWEHSGNVK